MDLFASRLLDVFTQRIGSLDDHGEMLIRPSDPRVAASLEHKITLSYMQLQADKHYLEVSLRARTTRPGRILYDEQTQELTAYTPTPMRAPSTLRESYAQIQQATLLVYNDIMRNN